MIFCDLILVLLFIFHNTSGTLEKEVSSKDGLFTSNLDLQGLVKTVEHAIQALNDYILMEQTRLKNLKQLVEDYKETYNKSIGDVKKYVENPLNSYHLIKILTLGWHEVTVSVNQSNSSVHKFFSNINSRNDLLWPNEEDLSGAVAGIKRLQEFYNIKTSNMAEGKLFGGDGGKLSASDCYHISMYSHKNKETLSAIEWLEQALKSLDDEKTDEDETMRLYIYHGLTILHHNLNEKEKALHYNNLAFMLQPNFIPAKHLKISEKYKLLCRNEIKLEERIKSKLKCRFNFGQSLIMPIKEEVVSLNPKISVFYEVISEAEVNMLQSTAHPTLERGGVGKHGRVSPHRIAQSTWVEKEDKMLTKIYRRISHITGLDTSPLKASESFQVVCYGIGGYYNFHFDFINDTSWTSDNGDRIATWMFYGSDIELGGATVFLDANVTVFPTKGSALFWYNLHRNGSMNPMTRHAGCPVLKGTKWGENNLLNEFHFSILKTPPQNTMDPS